MCNVYSNALKLCNASGEVTYVLFDLPGQVELFTLHQSLKHITSVLTDKWHYRFAVCHHSQLFDAHKPLHSDSVYELYI